MDCLCAEKDDMDDSGLQRSDLPPPMKLQDVDSNSRGRFVAKKDKKYPILENLQRGIV